MNRFKAGLFVGIAALLCLIGVVEIAVGLAKFALRILSWIDQFIPWPATSAVEIAEGARAPDYWLLYVFSWLLEGALIVGLPLAVALTLLDKKWLLYAKYWCVVTLILAALYLLGSLISPLVLFSFQPSKTIGFLGVRVAAMTTLLVQAVLIGAGTVFLDRELNRPS